MTEWHIRRHDRLAEQYQPLIEPAPDGLTTEWLEFYQAHQVRWRFYWGYLGRSAPDEEEVFAVTPAVINDIPPALRGGWNPATCSLPRVTAREYLDCTAYAAVAGDMGFHMNGETMLPGDRYPSQHEFARFVRERGADPRIAENYDPRARLMSE